jgi:hypothetical protein
MLVAWEMAGLVDEHQASRTEFNSFRQPGREASGRHNPRQPCPLRNIIFIFACNRHVEFCCVPGAYMLIWPLVVMPYAATAAVVTYLLVLLIS